MESPYPYRQGTIGIEIDYFADHLVHLRSVTKSRRRFLIRQPDLPIPRIVTGQFNLNVELSAVIWHWVAFPEG